MSSSDDSTARRPVRIGVAGSGYWGSNLVRVCAQLGALESICEIDDTARESTRRQYPNVAATADFHRFLKGAIDAVVIATPAQSHAELALAVITAGKHVFVEKPLALNVADGQLIAEAAEKHGVIAFVGHLLLYHPAVVKLRSLIEQQRIGQVRHIRSRRLSLGKLRNHENVWWSFAPHDVSLVLTLMEEEPHAATATQTSFRNGLADVAYADFQFSDGRTAHVETCWLDPEKSARLDVFGDCGVLTLTDSRNGSSLALKEFSIRAGRGGAPVVSRGVETSVDFEQEEPLEAEMRAFINAIRTGSSFPTTARHGVAVLRALSMADNSQITAPPSMRALA